jgi:hypothetical protein
MKAEPSPATPDLMMLMCILSGAMCGAVPPFVFMQILTAGALVPELGWVIHRWLDAEERCPKFLWERLADGDIGEPEEGFEDDDDLAAEGELRSGWVRTEGGVWLWRHVCSAGVWLIPVRWYGMMPVAAFLRRRRVCSPCWALLDV